MLGATSRGGARARDKWRSDELRHVRYSSLSNTMLYLITILYKPRQSIAMWDRCSVSPALFMASGLAAYVKRNKIYTPTEVDRQGFHQIMIS
jgi:hypothetical protein